MNKVTVTAVGIIALNSAICVTICILVPFNLFGFLESATNAIPFCSFRFSAEALPLLIGAIASVSAIEVIYTTYKGEFVSVLSKALGVIAGAFFVYFLLYGSLAIAGNQSIGFYTFLIVIVSSVYLASTKILKDSNQIILQTLTKTGALILIGFLSSALVRAFSPQNINIANMSLSGFFFAGITASFYPASFADKPKVRKAGAWLSKDTIGKIVIGIVIGFYIFYIHPIVYAIDPTITLLGEWLFIALVAVSGYLSIRSKVNGISAPLIVENWKKHQQELQFKTTQELTNLTEIIEEFLTYGNKNFILIYLTNFLFEKKVNSEYISYLLNDLINYVDVKPKMFSKAEEQLVKNLNAQKRDQVLSKTIKNIQKTCATEIGKRS
jgi:hypothetical protein